MSGLQIPASERPEGQKLARDGTPLAMLGFSTAAWRLAPRDRFIGWTPELRERNLPRVVDNPRFLILPWIRIPNLGSHILAIVRRQLPLDWTARYNTTPALIETFVRDPAPHRRRLPGIRLGPRRRHPGARALRREETIRQAEKGHLAAATAQGLEARPQPVGTGGTYRDDRTLTDAVCRNEMRSGKNFTFIKMLREPLGTS